MARRARSKHSGGVDDVHHRYSLWYEHLEPGGLRRDGSQPLSTPHGSGWRALVHRADVRGDSFGISRTICWRLAQLGSFSPFEETGHPTPNAKGRAGRRTAHASRGPSSPPINTRRHGPTFAPARRCWPGSGVALSEASIAARCSHCRKTATHSTMCWANHCALLADDAPTKQITRRVGFIRA